jgi:hypothetical protein
MMNLGDRVMSPPLGPEPIGDRHEVGLENGFQHQLKRRLDNPIRDRRYPEFAKLSGPTRFRDLAFPHRQRPKRAVLQGGPQVVQEPGHAHTLLDVGDRQAIHAGCACTLVSRDPVKCHHQRRRVVHEVEQVIEPAARIDHRPTVKFGLHLRYPGPWPARTLTRSVTIRWRIFQHCSVRPFSIPLPPFPMYAGSPRLGVLQRLRPAPDRSAVGAPSPRTRRTRASRARSGTVPVFTVVRSTKEEPDYAPAASPRVRRSLSSQPPWQLMPTTAGVPRQNLTGAHRFQPRSTRFRAGVASRGCHTPVPRVLLSIPLAEPRPSGSADRSRRCQGCSHPPRHHPDQAAPSSTAPLRRDQWRRSLTSTRTTAPHGAHTTGATPATSSPPHQVPAHAS